MAGTSETLTLSFYEETQTVNSDNTVTTTTTKKLEVVRDMGELGGGSNTNGFSLPKVALYKTINEPSRLEAELNFTNSIIGKGKSYASVAELINILSQSYLNVTLSRTEGTTTTTTNLALHYMVFSIVRSDQEANVKLAVTAYSPDKLLDIDEYCKAYTAKKLVREIVLNEGSKLESGTAPEAGKNIGQCARVATGTATTIYFTQEAASGSSSGSETETKMNATLKVENNLQVLRFKDSTGAVSDDCEFVQPYLVQYNETFYRFLVRTMNRYGEFVYYEDDALHLGLDEIMEQTETVDTSGNKVVTKSATALTADDVVSVEWNNSCVKADTPSLEQYAYTGAFHTPSSNEYHDETVDDANLVKIKTAKEKKSDFNSWQSDYAKRYFIDKVPKFPFLLPSISKIVFYVLDLAYNYFMDTGYATNLSVKNAYKSDILDPARSESANNGEVYPYTTNPDNTAGLGTIFSNKLIDSQLCRTIHQQEMAAQKGMITFHVEQQPGLYKLGQVVSYDGGTFVIAGVEYDYEKNEGKILALPKDDTYSMFLPLPIEERIRRASPQPAVVTDNQDHEGLGRVRIRFAWQTTAASGE